MRSLLIAIVLAGISAPVFAQTEQQQSAFARDRNISVNDREHPEYAPFGIRWNSLVLEPGLDTSLIFEDNVFGTQTDPKTDYDVQVAPSITLKSDWSRNQLSAYVKGSYDQFFKYHSEDQPQVDLGGTYQQDTGRNSYISLTGEYGYLVEPRASTLSPENLVDPLRYEQSSVSITDVTEINRFRYTITASAQGVAYRSGLLTDGTLLNESDADQVLVNANGKLEYAVNPGTSAYVYLGGDRTIYTHQRPGVDPDSSGFDVAIGTNFDITRLTRGDVRVGYLKQSYADSTQSVSGVSLDASVDYFPTQITTVHLEAQRAVQPTNFLAASTYLAQSVSLEVDHELFRNVILTGDASFEDDTYNGNCATVGCDFGRHDVQWSADFVTKYQLNRRVGLRFAYTHLNLTSSGPNRINGYSADQVQVTTQLRY